MYFEEPWFIDLNLRLNSFRNFALMSCVQNGGLSDYEEGEIVDDDDSPPPSLEHRPSVSDKCKGKESGLIRISGDLFLSSPARCYSPVKSHVREPPPRPENEKLVSRQILAKRRRHRLRRIRKQFGADAERPPPRSNTLGRRRQLSSVRDKPRTETSYEERLKELQRRTRRLNSSSKSESEYSKADSKTSSKPESKFNLKPGSKRDSNSKLESKFYPKSECKINYKSDYKVNSNCNERRTPRYSRKRSSETACSGGTSLLKRLVGSGSVAPGVLEDGISEQSKSPNIPSASENVENNAVLSPSLTLNEIPNTENEMSKEYDKEDLKVNESMSFPSINPDDELFQLRMEALKTAVLKKHNERLKRGYVPKKTIKECDDPFIDSLIEEVESVDSYSFDALDRPLTTDKDNNDLNSLVENADSSDMSLDSNYVSDDDAVVGDTGSELKRKHFEEYESNKKLKLEEYPQMNETSENDLTSDVNDEELQLRALALQSFLDRKSQKNSDRDDDESLKPDELSADKSEIEEIEEKDEIKIPKKRKSSENWEELDEDILRAQLLKTLSASLPEPVIPIEDKFGNASFNSIKTTSSFSKKELDPELELQSKLWSESMVPKLVISLGSDSESETEPSQIDFVKSLDLLLQEAKEKSEKVSAQQETKPKVKKKTPYPKNVLKKSPLRKGSSNTPVAVKHLPIQQQEEYRRLKLKLAEKMNSNKSKVFNSEFSTNSKTQSLLPSLPFKQPIPKAQPLSPLRHKQVTLASKSKTKLINRVDDVHNKNVPTVGASPKTVTSLKPIFQPPKNITNKVINRVKTSVSLNKNLIVQNGTDVITQIVDLPQSPKRINKNSIYPANKTESKKVPNNVPSVEKNLPVENPDIKLNAVIINNNDKSSAENIVESVDKKMVECLRDDTDDNNGKEKSSFSTQSVVSSVNIGVKVSSSLDDKHSDGNCDKENKTIKLNDAVAGSKEKQKVIARSGIESEVTDKMLTERLKDAETKYGQTLNLVLRLEKQLEEAKKTLIVRGKTVSDLKQLIKGSNAMTTLSVKVSGREASCKKPDDLVSVPVKDSASPRSCMDPDGVLCPFELSGCCKDASCTFNHIHT